MKNRIYIAAALLMILAAACKRDKDPGVPAAPCAACYDAIVGYPRDSDGVYFYYPNAFTPNGDGKNDLLYMMYDQVDTANSSISIWDANGVRVFSGRISQSWDGRDSSGGVCAPGKYPVQIKLRTIPGKIYELCACANLVSYTGGCIATQGKTYVFGDQVNPDSAYIYDTGERLCP